MSNKKDVERRLKEAVKSLKQQWGHGWNRLGYTLQQALVRAEILSIIGMLDGDFAADQAAYSVNYRALVEALTLAAMRWEPDNI